MLFRSLLFVHVTLLTLTACGGSDPSASTSGPAGAGNASTAATNTDSGATASTTSNPVSTTSSPGNSTASSGNNTKTSGRTTTSSGHGTTSPGSTTSPPAKSSTPTAVTPSTPSGLAATAGNAQVTLTWIGQGASYCVERATSSGGPYKQIGTSSSAVYTDTGLTNGTTYFYVVVAENSAGASATSNQASAAPKGSAVGVKPLAPTGLAAASGDAQVTLTWSGQGTSYLVERATQNGGPYSQIATPTGVAYTDTNLTDGRTYYYVVAAMNSAGTGPISGQVSASPVRAINVVFDLDSSHEFTGFGAETWVSSDHIPELTDLLINTSANFHRILSLSPPLLPGDLRDDMTVAQIVALFNERETAEWKQRTAQFAVLMKSLKLSTEFVLPGMPSPWVLITTSADGTKHYTANPARLPVFANYVVAETIFALQAGFPITFMEATGEPDGDWGTLFTPALYAQLMSLVHDGLIANGLSQVQLEGPGTSKEAAAAPFIEALMPAIRAGYIKAISVHAYDSADLNEDVFGFPDSLQAALAALPASPRLPIHITEFNEENHVWDNPPFCGGPNINCTANNSADSPDFAVSIVALTLNQYNQGVNKATIWQAQDQVWDHTSRGVIDLAGRVRPSGRAISSVFGPLSGGGYVKTVGGTTIAPGVYATAFFGEPNGTITNISSSFTNTAKTATTLAVQFQHSATLPTYSIANQSVFLGSGQTPSVKAATLVGGTLTVTLPPRSVVTVTLGF